MAAARKSSFVIPPKPPYSPEWVWVDVPTAVLFMSKNHPANRRLRKAWRIVLSRAFSQGEYLPTHQGVAFDEEGFLVDGQHRLQAIIDSGIAQWLLVTRDLPRQALLLIDLHSKRSQHEQISMMDPSLHMSCTDQSIARAMSLGASTGGTDHPGALRTTPALHAFFLRHQDAIRFCQHKAKGKGVRVAPIRAAIGRAYYHEDHKALVRYMEVFATGEALGPHEWAASSFRVWVMDGRNAHIVTGGQDQRATLYGYAAASIAAFLKGQKGRNLKPITAEEDPWPLPGDHG